MEGERSLTYRELDRLVDAAAGWLTANGVGRGDRVALLAENSTAYAALMLAAARTGCILACQNWRLTARELRHCISLVEPKMVLVSDRFATLLDEVDGGGGDGAAARHRLDDRLAARWGGSGAARPVRLRRPRSRGDPPHPLYERHHRPPQGGRDQPPGGARPQPRLAPLLRRPARGHDGGLDAVLPHGRGGPRSRDPARRRQGHRDGDLRRATDRPHCSPRAARLAHHHARHDGPDDRRPQGRTVPAGPGAGGRSHAGSGAAGRDRGAHPAAERPVPEHLRIDRDGEPPLLGEPAAARGGSGAPLEATEPPLRAPPGRHGRQRRPRRDPRRGGRPRSHPLQRLLARRRDERQGLSQRLVPHGRPHGPPRGRDLRLRRPGEVHDQVWWREHLSGRDRAGAPRRSAGRGGGGGAADGRALGRGAGRVRGAPATGRPSRTPTSSDAAASSSPATSSRRGSASSGFDDFPRSASGKVQRHELESLLAKEET